MAKCLILISCLVFGDITSQYRGVPTSLGYAKCNFLKIRKVCERSELRLQNIDSIKRGNLNFDPIRRGVSSFDSIKRDEF